MRLCSSSWWLLLSSKLMKRKIEMGIHGVRQLLHSNIRYRKKNTQFSLFRAVNGGLETRVTYKAQKYGRHLEMVRSEFVFPVSARKLFLFYDYFPSQQQATLGLRHTQKDVRFRERLRGGSRAEHTVPRWNAPRWLTMTWGCFGADSHRGQSERVHQRAYRQRRGCSWAWNSAARHKNIRHHVTQVTAGMVGRMSQKRWGGEGGGGGERLKSRFFTVG